MKRILVIFLTVLLVVPSPLIRADDAEKKSSWVNTAQWAGSALAAALLLYMGVKSMDNSQGQYQSGQPVSRKRTAQENISLVHELELIYKNDRQIREEVHSKDWLGMTYQGSLTDILTKKYPELVKDYKGLTQKFNPLDTAYFEGRLRGDRDFFEYYYPMLIDYYRLTITDYGTPESYQDMRRLLPGLPAQQSKSQLQKSITEKEQKAEAARRQQEAARKQQETAMGRQQEAAKLAKKICIASRLEKIYFTDPNIALERQDPNSQMVTADAYFKSFYKKTRDKYPQVYKKYEQIRNPQTDPVGIHAFQKIDDTEFKKEFYDAMIYYFKSLINKIGSDSSQTRMDEVFEKSC